MNPGIFQARTVNVVRSGLRLRLSQRAETSGPGSACCIERLAETTMSSPHLPAEILDHVIDYSHDAQDVLSRNCFFVSKPWVQRTPKHLFANVDFPLRRDHTVIEGDISRSFRLSCALHQDSICRLPQGRHGCRCGSGWLVHGFSSIGSNGIFIHRKSLEFIMKFELVSNEYLSSRGASRRAP